MSFGLDATKLSPINKLESNSTLTLDSITAEEGTVLVNNEFAIGQLLLGTSTSPIQVGTLTGGLLDTTLDSDTSINVTNTDGQNDVLTTDDRGGAIALYASYATLGSIDGTLNATSYGQTHGISLVESSITSFTGTMNVIELESVPMPTIVNNQTTTGILLKQNSRIDALGGTTNVSSYQAAIGVEINGNSSVDTISGTVNASSETKEVKGVYFSTSNSHTAFDNANITVVTNSQSSSATGIDFSGTTSGTITADIHANVSVTGKSGQLSWIIAKTTTDTLGTISGTYYLESVLSDISEGTDYSVGYVAGIEAPGTFSTVGFRNSETRSSEGLTINWDDVSMTVNRHLGLAGGLVLVDNVSDITIGAGSSVTGIVGLGGALGAWVNGSSMDNIEGTISGYGAGSTATGMPATIVTGLLTTGHSAANGVEINQSEANSTIGDISGTISATIGANGRATALVIGHTDLIRQGSIWSKPHVYKEVSYESTIGTISGNIIANSLTNDRVEVIGIQDIADRTIQFANGATVSATVNSNNKLAEFGTAMLNTNNGIKVSSSALSTAGSVNIVGDLNAGAQILQFEQGRYNVESHNWTANGEKAGAADQMGGVIVGKGRETAGDLSTAYQTSRVNLVDMVSSSSAVDDFSRNTTLATSTLSFYTNNASDSSQIYVGSGRGLEFDGLEIVKVYLTGSEADYTSRLYFVDALNAATFDEDNTGITYHIYFDDSTTAHTQHDSFKIVHDSTGIYLHIPEPSTATLSLLALSGLLARRRRRCV